MRYQTIDPDNKIVNHTAFGRRLRRFLRKPEQRALLPQGARWRVEGAWMLADALVHWSGGWLKLTGLRRPDGAIDHVVVRDPGANLYIDGDGVAAPVELMTKMAIIRHAPTLIPTELTEADSAAIRLPYLEDVAVELAMRLLYQFGRYRPDLLSLGGEYGLQTIIERLGTMGHEYSAGRRSVGPAGPAFA